jgi:hypothetical protein
MNQRMNMNPFITRRTFFRGATLGAGHMDSHRWALDDTKRPAGGASGTFPATQPVDSIG